MQNILDILDGPVYPSIGSRWRSVTFPNIIYVVTGIDKYGLVECIYEANIPQNISAMPRRLEIFLKQVRPEQTPLGN